MKSDLLIIMFPIDVIHAIVYSFLLLNTDLHVALGDYKRMSQAAFIKNTMDAISSGTSPASMRSNSSVGSFDFIPLERILTNSSDISAQSSIDAQSIESSAPMPRNLSCLSFGSKTWQHEIKSLLKQMYSSIRKLNLQISLHLPLQSAATIIIVLVLL